MKLIVSIVERGQGKDLIRLFTQQNVLHHMQCGGKGTATSEIMDLLGLDSLEKDVVFSIGKGTLANQLMRDLNHDLRGSLRVKGIVFDMKLTAMAHVTALAILAPVKNEQGREDTMMEEGKTSSMILVTVNQGFTDTVMDTARKAGARGGTIIRGRWVGDESFAQSRGITSLQAEKELIFIVVATEIRNKVMEAINREHGLESEAGAMVSAIGIEQLAHLG